MTKLQNLDAKVCLTASGCLIHQGKVLLIKHKKLNSWLCPGGHIDPDELPHQAAEREFWEETGVKVKAFDPKLKISSQKSEYVPSPVLSNLHWVCRDNYLVRTQHKKPNTQTKIWHKGCEQHCDLFFLVQPASKDLSFRENVEETDGIGWFTLSELKTISLYDNVYQEIKTAFDLCQN